MAAETILMFTNTHATMAASDRLTVAGASHRVIPRPVALSGDCGVAILLTPEAVRQAQELLAGAEAVTGCFQRLSRADEWQPCLKE